MGLTWSDGLSTGGTPIIDYRVSYDQGIGEWQVLSTGVSLKQYVRTTLDQGVVYTFRVEARNAIGYSLQSEEV